VASDKAVSKLDGVNSGGAFHPEEKVQV